MSPPSPKRQRQIEDALSAYRTACARGEKPDAAALMTRFPELAEMIDAAAPTVDREPIVPVAAPPEYTDYPTQADDSADREAEPRPQVTLPGYDVLSEIARGGMGVVYKARQQVTNRIVAVKMLLAGVHSQTRQRRRFLAEAEAVGRLAHPNIVQVYEAGESDGLPFYAMEYCTGGSVADYQGGPPMPASLAAGLVECIARAAHAMHQHNLIHRDLKPGNILLAVADRMAPETRPTLASADLLERWVPKLTDFGLAKNLEADGVTASQAVIGTPSYMAPEQAGGKSKHVGPAADVWSLGAILYDLLTGRPPFGGNTLADTVSQVLFQEPLSLRRLRPAVPRDLELICLKCLEKETHLRYLTAEDLADDLKRFQTGQPVSVRPLGRLTRMGRWCRRNPLVAGLVAAVFVALLAGAIVASVFAMREMERAEAEEEARRDAENEQAIAQKARRETEQELYMVNAHRALLAWRADDAHGAVGVLDQSRLDLRGWEYQFLSTLLRSKPESLGAIGGRPATLAWSANGARLACGLEDGTVTVWDTTSGKKLFTQRPFKSEVVALAFSPDGTQLAAGSRDRQDRTIKLWHLGKDPAANSGPKPILLDGHELSVESIAFSADGTRLASGGTDTKLIVWDARNGQPMLMAKDVRFGILSLAFNNDGTRLVSGGVASSLLVWDVSSSLQSSPRVLADHTPSKANAPTDFAVTAVGFSPDGNRIGWGDERGRIGIWDPKSRHEMHAPAKAELKVTALWFSSNRRLVSTSRQGLLRIWDIEDNALVFDVATIARGSRLVELSSDGRRFAATEPDNTLHIWSLGRPFEAQALVGHSDAVMCVSYSSDGKRIVSGGNDGAICVRDATTGRLAFTMYGHQRAVSSIALSPDNRIFASASKDQTVKIWDLASGKLLQTLDDYREPITGVTFSPSGDLLATVAGSEVRLWSLSAGGDARTFKHHKTIPIPDEDLRCVAFAPRGHELGVGSSSGKLRVWSIDGLRDVRTIQAHKGPVTSLAFAPNNESIVTAGMDKTAGTERMVPQIRIWNAAKDTPTLTLNHLTKTVNAVAVSPDGRLLVSGSDDRTVKLWDLVRGTELKTLREPNAFVYSVAFSPDGRHLVAGCDNVDTGDEGELPPDRRLLLWQVPPLDQR